MLIISRKRDEIIKLIHPSFGEITIMVTGILGDKVRLGIDAPLDVIIDRGEITEKEDYVPVTLQQRMDRRKYHSKMKGEPCETESTSESDSTLTPPSSE